MAHELTFKDGVAQVFSTRLPMWHQEGHILEEAPTYEQALQLGGLDFEVEARPLFIGKRTDDGDEYYVQSRFGRVIVRTDNEAELGTVGQGYTPLQNRDAFRVLEPLLDADLAKLETGGSLREGADCWLMVRFNAERFGPIVREVFADEVIPYGLIANNHNGRRGVLLQLTPIRVVCANTLGMAEEQGRRGLSKAITCKHTKGVASATVAAAEQLFRGLSERYEVVAQQYRLLKQTVIDEEAFRVLVEDVVSQDPRQNPRFNPEAKLAEMVVARAEQRRAKVRHLWTNGRGHTGDHSAWEAYNAAAEAMDHEEDLWPVRDGSYRTRSLLEGRLGEFKGTVLNGLVKHARQLTKV